MKRASDAGALFEIVLYHIEDFVNAHTKIDENVALRRRVEELEEEVRYLRGLLRPEVDHCERAALGLQRQEWVVLQVLRSASPNYVHHERLFACLKSRSEDEAGLLRNRVYTLRRKLRQHGVVISTAWGDGLFIDAENRARLEAAIENSTKNHGETEC